MLKMLNFKFLIYLDSFILFIYFFLLKTPFNPLQETDFLLYVLYVVGSYTTILLSISNLFGNKINLKFEENKLLYTLPIIFFYLFNTTYLILYNYGNLYPKIKNYIMLEDKIYFQFLIILLTMKILIYIGIFKKSQ